MASFIETVANDLIDQIKQDTLVLPSLPEVCLKVRDVAEDMDSSIPQLADLIIKDAALTARIIKVANSPLVRTPSEVTDLVTAISRLGINFTSNLAMGLAMEQLFQATSDVVDKRMRSIWKQSTEVASICHVLAGHYTKLHPEEALLAGLIHKIGALPILKYAEDNSALLNDGLALDRLIEKLHPVIGTRILKSWKLPKDILNVPSQYLKFDREIDNVDYADLVTVAVLQTHANTGHPYAQLDWSKIHAFERVGLSSDMDTAEAINLEDIGGLLD